MKNHLNKLYLLLISLFIFSYNANSQDNPCDYLGQDYTEALQNLQSCENELNFTNYSLDDCQSTKSMLQEDLDNALIQLSEKQALITSLQSQITSLENQLNSIIPEDGITQQDVDDAIAAIIPEDGISQEDVDEAVANLISQYETEITNYQNMMNNCESNAINLSPLELDIPINLPQGWSMFGYTCLESLDVVEAFSGVSDNIEIVKDELGLAYLPSWGFSAFDNLSFGQGYQIKLFNSISDFQFCKTLVERISGCTDNVAFNYDSTANYDDGSCIPVVMGCMEEDAFNYNIDANTEDNTCIDVVLGCTDNLADNFNSNANTNDNSCIWTGCTNILFLEYNEMANVDDGSCETNATIGCTDSTALNFNSSANLDISYSASTSYLTYGNSGSGGYVEESYNVGDLNLNFIGGANIYNGISIQGYANEVTITYGSNLNFNIESFGLSSYYESSNSQFQCLNGEVIPGNYFNDGASECGTASFPADCSDGSDEECMGVPLGSMLSNDDNFFIVETSTGYSDSTTTNLSYLSFANINWLKIKYKGGGLHLENLEISSFSNQSTCILPILGCTDTSFLEYSSEANTDDGSCSVISVPGCMDETAFNFNPEANNDNGNCIPVSMGCIDNTMCNYNSSANTDDGSCYNNDLGCGCDTPAPAKGYDCNGNLLAPIYLQVSGNGKVEFVNISGYSLEIYDWDLWSSNSFNLVNAGISFEWIGCSNESVGSNSAYVCGATGINDSQGNSLINNPAINNYLSYDYTPSQNSNQEPFEVNFISSGGGGFYISGTGSSLIGYIAPNEFGTMECEVNLGSSNGGWYNIPVYFN